MCQKTSFMFQGVYGKAIANYIQDISDLGYDLIPNPDKNGRLKASAMWGFLPLYNKTGHRIYIRH